MLPARATSSALGLLACCLFLAAARPVFAQNLPLSDTTAIARTVDSLILLNKKLAESRSDMPAAAAAIEAAERLTEATFGKNTARYAACLHWHGWTMVEWSKYPEAEAFFREALAIRERVLGKENADWAASMTGFGTAIYRQGRLDEAEKAYREALAVRQKVLGKDHPDVGGSLHNLGNLANQRGQLDQAEAFFTEAVAVRRRAFGDTHTSVARSLGGLASVHWAASRLDRAEALQREALEIFRKTLGEKHFEYAMNLRNLGGILSDAGRKEQAELSMAQALGILEQLGQGETTQAALVLRALGGLNEDLGRWEKSEDFHQRGIAIVEKTQGRNSLDYASAINYFAVLQNSMGNFERAFEGFDTSRAIIERMLGLDNPTYADVLNNLGKASHNLARYEAAETYFRKTLAVYERTTGRETLTFARTLANLANVLRDRERPGDAEPLLREVLTLREKLVGPQHWEVIQSLQNLGGVYRELGRYDESKAFYGDMARRHREGLRRYLRYFSEDEMAAYVATLAKDQARHFSLAQFLASKNPPGASRQTAVSPGLAADCFDQALLQKEFLLDAVVQRASLAGRDSTASRLDESHRAVCRRLEKEYAQAGKPDENPRLTALQNEANDLERQLAQRIAGLGEAAQKAGWQDVRAALGPGEAAVEFVHFRYHDRLERDSVFYAALVLSAGAAQPVFVPLFEENSLGALLERPGYGEQNTVKDLYGNRSDLFNLLSPPPLETALAGAKTIFYAPGGLLHRVNLAAIENAEGRSFSENGRQWVRLGSTRELLAKSLADQSFAAPAPQNSTAIVLGGIRYDMDSLAFAKANPQRAVSAEHSSPTDFSKNWSEENTFGASGQAGGFRGPDAEGWPPLPGAEQEAAAVAKRLTEAGFAVEQRAGFAASEDWLKKQRGATPFVLHFATHGFAFPPKTTLGGADGPAFKNARDPMLRSGLLLAGANFFWKNRRPLVGREDGVLLAHEVQNLDLRGTELAVLSACRTGLGDVGGAEGVYGLQRAFRVAGARFLLVSLWQVPDEATRDMMTLFYEKWTGRDHLPLREAFRQAQAALKLRHGNPYLWAGFVLVE